MTITVSAKADPSAINPALERLGQILSGEVADDGTLLINYLRGGINLSDEVRQRIACDYMGCNADMLAATRRAVRRCLQASQGGGWFLAAVASERMRQIGKGYDEAHDDALVGGELAWGAAYFATKAQIAGSTAPEKEALSWPFKSKWPEVHPSLSGRRDALVKAAAMLMAEAERIDRQIDREEAAK